MSRKTRPTDETPPPPQLPPPEFSRPVEISELPEGGHRWSLEAKAEERAALAKRFDLVSLDALTGTVRVVPLAGGGLGARVEGRFEARVTQRCVVSLEPFETALAESFRLELRPPDELEGASEVLAEDDIEPLDAPTLDIGELLAQHLSLTLDPHPRKPGVALEWAGAAAPDGQDSTQSPFAVLGDLRRKM